mmetsp:Transcript_13739/g.27865  ORF Transcript_13739/g.27865 Transcript_13739/m.27865 type:complete len:246 (+) Transcript_13739:195-932(+)
MASEVDASSEKGGGAGGDAKRRRIDSDSSSPQVVKDSFIEFLDAVEEKYGALIMIIGGTTEEEEKKSSDFSEEWFFGEYEARHPFIMLREDVGNKVKACIAEMRQFYRFNVNMVADSTSYKLSPNHFAFGNKNNETHEKIARDALAKMIALMYDMCLAEKECDEKIRTGDYDDAMWTMSKNWEKILKYSDQDLGIMRGTRKHLMHLIDLWTSLMKTDDDGDGDGDADGEAENDSAKESASESSKK